MAQQYARISADSHLEVPAGRWTHRVAPAYRDVAPRTITLADGADATVVGDLPPRQNPMDLYGGKGRDVWKPFGQRYEDTPGTGSPEQRLREQDLDHTSAEVLFPAVVVGPRYWSKLPDPRAVQAIFRGWNDWLGEEYCAYAPSRLFGVGAIPPTGVDDAIAEVQRCAELGLRAVMLTTFPNGGVRPLPEDDRFWAASIDVNMPVTIHVELDPLGRPERPVARLSHRGPRRAEEHGARVSGPTLRARRRHERRADRALAPVRPLSRSAHRMPRRRTSGGCRSSSRWRMSATTGTSTGRRSCSATSRSPRCPARLSRSTSTGASSRTARASRCGTTSASTT